MVILKLVVCCLPLFSSCFISTAHVHTFIFHPCHIFGFQLSSPSVSCSPLSSSSPTPSLFASFSLFPHKWLQHSHSAESWPLSLCLSLASSKNKMSIAKMSEKSQWLPAALSPQSNHSRFSLNSWISFTLSTVCIHNWWIFMHNAQKAALFIWGRTHLVLPRLFLLLSLPVWSG